MDKVRIGIIGMGNMGSSHSEYLIKKEVPCAKLTAVCDIDNEKLKKFGEKYGQSIKKFVDADDLMSSGLVDGVIIANYHYDHPTYAIKALENRLHVLIEKPAGVYTNQVEEMNIKAEASNRVFGIMLNQRTDPLYRKLRDLIKSGELGEIKRSNWIITDWYRPQSYYDSSDWRATWAKEGGGVLINQCPHQLDLWQWICGMPKKIRAFGRLGKYHDIEVEDDITIYAEYENKATGLFIATTGESPGTNRFEIAGDMGKLVREDDKLTFWRLRVSERQYNNDFKGSFGKPEVWKADIPITGENEQHKGITKNWVDAILNGTPLLARGQEGIYGLQISNAAYLSSWTNKMVALPVDGDLYYEKLKEKIDSTKKAGS